MSQNCTLPVQATITIYIKLVKLKYTIIGFKICSHILLVSWLYAYVCENANGLDIIFNVIIQ